MSDTDLVYVKRQDAAESDEPGRVPRRALPHWQAKGYVETTRDGKPVEDDSEFIADVTPVETVAEPVAEPIETPQPIEGEDGTAAGSADDPSPSDPAEPARGARRSR